MPRPRGRGTSPGYEREQVQPLPHWQVGPQVHPGRRVSVFVLDIGISWYRAGLMPAFRQMTQTPGAHYTGGRPVY